MVKGELQHKEKENMAAQNDKNNGRALGLSGHGLGRQEGGSGVPDDQSAGYHGRNTQCDPRNDREWNDRQDNGRHVRNQRISVQGNPFDECQCVHVHAARGGHPQDRWQGNGKSHENRGSVHQVINVVIEFIYIVSVGVTMDVCRDL